MKGTASSSAAQHHHHHPPPSKRPRSSEERQDQVDVNDDADGEPNNHEPPPVPAQPAAASRACFLCRFNSTPDARLIHTYMVENIGSTCPEVMAQEMARTLARLHPDQEGIDLATCLEHLKRHTLTPVIRLALTLRSLLQLSDRMDLTLERLGEDYDLKLVDMYLKVQNHILNIYKNPDANKMFLADKASA